MTLRTSTSILLATLIAAPLSAQSFSPDRIRADAGSQRLHHARSALPHRAQAPVKDTARVESELGHVLLGWCERTGPLLNPADAQTQCISRSGVARSTRGGLVSGQRVRVALKPPGREATAELAHAVRHCLVRELGGVGSGDRCPDQIAQGRGGFGSLGHEAHLAKGGHRVLGP